MIKFQWVVICSLISLFSIPNFSEADTARNSHSTEPQEEQVTPESAGVTAPEGSDIPAPQTPKAEVKTDEPQINIGQPPTTSQADRCDTQGTRWKTPEEVTKEIEERVEKAIAELEKAAKNRKDYPGEFKVALRSAASMLKASEKARVGEGKYGDLTECSIAETDRRNKSFESSYFMKHFKGPDVKAELQKFRNGLLGELESGNRKELTSNQLKDMTEKKRQDLENQRRPLIEETWKKLKAEPRYKCGQVMLARKIALDNQKGRLREALKPYEEELRSLK